MGELRPQIVNVMIDRSASLGFRSSCLTVAEVLGRMHRGEYMQLSDHVRPACEPDRIIGIMDELMRGEPITPFILWDVLPTAARGLALQRVAYQFDERFGWENLDDRVPEGRGVTVVLDGVQRLTALNIAARGFYAQVLYTPRFWHCPPGILCFRLSDDPACGEPDFCFFVNGDYRLTQDGPVPWFPVPHVMSLCGEQDIDRVLRHYGFAGDPRALERLWALYEALKLRRSLHCSIITATEQDVGKARAIADSVI